ncbi:mCG145075, partial [Mus musculus]
ELAVVAWVQESCLCLSPAAALQRAGSATCLLCGGVGEEEMPSPPLTPHPSLPEAGRRAVPGPHQLQHLREPTLQLSWAHRRTGPGGRNSCELAPRI